MSIAFTVLMATRNGEHVLERTLEAYCRAIKPEYAWKMVIVDNGSEDSTPAILESFKKRLPLEIIRQPVAGQNRARNSGLNALQGRLAIFTDDDAIPDASFLTAWSRFLDEAQDFEIFGGPIDVLFEVPPPKWILMNNVHFDVLFALRDLPEGPIDPHKIFSPNMAVRTSVFEKGYRFHETIGPSGSDPHYAMGSETEFCRRIARYGAKAWFAKEPRVQHIVRRNQLSESYWARRFYRFGRGEARQLWESEQALPPYLSRPLWVEQMWRFYHRGRMLSPFPMQRIKSLRAYHWKKGFLDEWAGREAAKNTPGCQPAGAIGSGSGLGEIKSFTNPT